jgi:hypothetical protein
MADVSLPRRRIAPLAILFAAAAMTWRGFDTLLRLGWLAALASTVAGVLLEPSPPQPTPDGTALEMAPGAVLMLFLLGLLALVLQSMVAVGWLRALLLGEDRPGRRSYLRLGARELMFALISFILMMMLALAATVLLPMAYGELAAHRPISGIFFLAVTATAPILLARSVLVLPALALGRSPELSVAWQAVGGNTVRVVALLLMAGLAVGILGFVVLWVFSTVHDRELGLPVDAVVMFVNALVSFTLMAFVLSVLGLLYALLVDERLRPMLPFPAERFFRS